MVFAGVYVGRDGDRLRCLKYGTSARNGIIFVQDPRVHRILHQVLAALASLGAMGVMVKIVVDLQIIGPQFHIIRKQIIEEDSAAAGILLTIQRCSSLSRGKDIGRYGIY